MKDIIIVGGGLAGLINAIRLAEAGLDVLLLEKKAYPFHRVCGEYISNEVVPFLESIQAFPYDLAPSSIRQFMLTACSGASATMTLDLGGFGVSRYALDQFLCERAQQAGAEIRQQTAVQSISFKENCFQVTLPQNKVVEATIVIGAYGKRSRLDKQLQRPFMQQRSPYIGVKYHVRTDFPDDRIALHNFPGGYCGISRVEDGRYNMCYLGSRAQLKKHGSIEAMETKVLHQNPFLRDLWYDAEFLLDKPEVINEISFAPKQPVVDHILMSGDTAGLITPLCGNGMAMAIHSAKMLSDLIIQHYQPTGFDRSALEVQYTDAWKKQFAARLWVGRNTQRLFGTRITSEIGVQLVKRWRSLARSIMQYTHGEPF
uniref:NAD(P)/FAD-dependent oxidoreductase n=1 Tax=Roseihalotalea indica TaxID=2867963 RepID=A0AA49GUF0_9BACT|nr:NAD(P)/FAD-dependent oxidoreductase [Tunicatimonas sp. TK19036]